MGRPKVLPANRLRANTACTACRASKKRCSGSFPCSNCIHKGRARSCIPFKSIPDSPVRTRPSASVNVAENLDVNWENLPAEPQTPLISPHNDFADPQREHALGVGSRSPEATHRTHARMLLNLQGERGIVLREDRPRKSKPSQCLTSYYSLCWKSCFDLFPPAPARHRHTTYRALAVFA